MDVILTSDHAVDNQSGLGKMKESLSRPGEAEPEQTLILLMTVASNPAESLFPKGNWGQRDGFDHL